MIAGIFPNTSNRITNFLFLIQEWDYYSELLFTVHRCSIYNPTLQAIFYFCILVSFAS